MKTRKLFSTLCVSLLIVELFSGCKGPQGEVGPVGPQGPGEIIYSKWASYTNNWTGSETSVYRERPNIPVVPEINSEADIFLVYGRYGDAIALLPSDFSRAITFSFESENRATFFYCKIKAESSLAITTSRLGAYSFRWVIIKPSGDPYGRKAAIDYSDYEAVKKAYNIPD